MDSFQPHRDPPTTLYLSLSSADVCNYSCRHCHIWRHDLRETEITLENRARWLSEFAEMNPSGNVILTGGEVLLNAPEYFEIANTAQRLGLSLCAMSNGLLIDSEEMAGRVVLSGASHFVISLDSHLPEIHAYTRGRARAFEETTDAIRRLVGARERSGSPIRILVAHVIFKENLPLFGDFVQFCRTLGVDHVDFQLLGATFANAHPSRDVFFEKHFWHTPIEKLVARELFRAVFRQPWATDGFVLKSAADLDWIEKYVDDPKFTTALPICGSHHSNLILDIDGNGSLCFNTKAILPDPFVGNARNQSLRQLWESAKARADREVMDHCRLGCGALNCHRRKTPNAA